MFSVREVPMFSDEVQDNAGKWIFMLIIAEHTAKKWNAKSGGKLKLIKY
jgi:hypothetical protein